MSLPALMLVRSIRETEIEVRPEVLRICVIMKEKVEIFHPSYVASPASSLAPSNSDLRPRLSENVLLESSAWASLALQAFLHK